MGKPKTYTLNIQDILQIPEESFDNFLTDLRLWHKSARNMVNLLNTIADATDQPIPDEFVTMRWIDDGKHDGKIIIKSAPIKEGDNKLTTKDRK